MPLPYGNEPVCLCALLGSQYCALFLQLNKFLNELRKVQAKPEANQSDATWPSLLRVVLQARQEAYMHEKKTELQPTV
jgi:hypothetical protein